MGDMGEMWEGYAEQRKTNRSNNREHSAKMLRTFDIEFTSHNTGAHLIIKCGDGFIDFWPGTGKWLVRGESVSKRGVMSLVEFYQFKLKEKNK